MSASQLVRAAWPPLISQDLSLPASSLLRAPGGWYLPSPRVYSLVLWIFAAFDQCKVAAGEQKGGGQRVWGVIPPSARCLANIGSRGMHI